MPRFSVIIPVYKVQAYLPACLNSVLNQTFTDIEIIAVNDASPDECGALLDAFVRRDPRVIPVHLEENRGLGPARNEGMQHAKGDYLLFLDSDDTMTPGSLRAIDERLRATDEPDVLIYDHALTYWNGEVRPNQFARLLARTDAPTAGLTQRPELLRVLQIACNKAYRREFVDSQGFTFRSGWYEDTAWTYPVLMRAESIATLGRTCLHYRQRRHGSIIATTSAKHFDIFAQYDSVFAYLDRHPELARWRRHIYRRMLDHFGTVINDPKRLPAASRAAFARRARHYHRRHATPGPAPAAPTRIRHALVGLGAQRLFRLLRGAQQTAGHAKRRIAWMRRALQAGVLQAHYRIQRLMPVRGDYAVFAAYWSRGYACNPAAIEAKVRELAPGIRTAWIARPEHAHTIPASVRHLRPGSAAYWTALARAKYLVNNVNFDRRLVKRRGQVLLQTQHGTPLKNMGIDLQQHPAAAESRDFAEMLRSVDKWDYCLSPNPHSTATWQSAYPSGYTILESGYPRNDRYLQATDQEIRDLRAQLGITPGTTAILYAPTHRDYRRDFVPQLDLARLLHALGPGHQLLVRAHYFYGGDDRLAELEAAGHIIDVSHHPSIEDLCLASDALITDYSSLMFDYANLDRPILIHAPDWDAYRLTRGVYFDLLSGEPGNTPGPISHDEDTLADHFRSGRWNAPEATALRTAFRTRFCAYEDGHAAERVVRHIFLREKALMPITPPTERHTALQPNAGVQQAALTTVFPPQSSPESNVPMV